MKQSSACRLAAASFVATLLGAAPLQAQPASGPPNALQGFSQNRDKRTITRKENILRIILVIYSLGCNVESDKRFTGSRDTCNKTNGSLTVIFGVGNNFTNGGTGCLEISENASE